MLAVSISQILFLIWRFVLYVCDNVDQILSHSICHRRNMGSLNGTSSSRVVPDDGPERQPESEPQWELRSIPLSLSQLLLRRPQPRETQGEEDTETLQVCVCAWFGCLFFSIQPGLHVCVCVCVCAWFDCLFFSTRFTCVCVCVRECVCVCLVWLSLLFNPVYMCVCV